MPIIGNFSGWEPVRNVSNNGYFLYFQYWKFVSIFGYLFLILETFSAVARPYNLCWPPRHIAGVSTLKGKTCMLIRLLFAI